MPEMPEMAEMPDAMTMATKTLTAKAEPFDSFWELPGNVEGSRRKFQQFYRHNYLRRFPADQAARILIIGCGPGYLTDLLLKAGYTNVRGIDSRAEKVRYALERELPCQAAEAFPFLEQAAQPFDMICLESELNHLTKEEIIEFAKLCRRRLRPGGTLLVHSLNGANPFTGTAALAQNIDHYNTFTDYSLTQALRLGGFEDVTAFPLRNFVFWTNPLNYVGLALERLIELGIRGLYALYAKKHPILTKKFAAIARNGA